MAPALIRVPLFTLLFVGEAVRDVMPDMSALPGRDLSDRHLLDAHESEDPTATSNGRPQVDHQTEAQGVSTDGHVLSVIQRSAQQQQDKDGTKLSQADVERFCLDVFNQVKENTASFGANEPGQKISSGLLNGLTSTFKSLFNPKLLDERYTIPLVGLGVSSSVNLDLIQRSFAAVLPNYAASPGAALAVWLTDPTHMPSGKYGTVPAAFIVERELSVNFMEDHMKHSQEHSLSKALTVGSNVAVKIALKEGLSSADGVTVDDGWSFVVGYSFKPSKTTPAIGVAVGFGIKERADGSCCWIEDVGLSGEVSSSDGFTLALAHGKSWAWQADSPNPWLDYVTRFGGTNAHIDHDQAAQADDAILDAIERRIGRRLFVMTAAEQDAEYAKDDAARKDTGGDGFFNKVLWTLKEAKDVAMG